MKEGHLKYSRLSWEPEMFISGGLVYTLFQIPKLLSQIKVYVEPLGGFPGLNEMLVTIAYGFAVLTVGFILHLTIKTVWVGMNAYNYAHGNLLHTERFKILDKFSKHNSTDLNDHILKVNQIAGLFFGTSVFLLMSFLGLVIYFVVVMTIGWVIDAPGLYYNSTIVPILIYLFDNLTFGLLRKNRYVSKVYYPVYMLMTFLTLSFIYRPMYYSLIANYSKLKVIALVVSIIILSFPLMIRNSAKVLKIQGTLGESWAFYETAAPWDLSNTRILSDFKYLDKYDEGGRISYFVLETYYSDRDVLNIYFSFKYVNPLFENDNSSKLSEDQFQELIDEQIHVVIDNKPITGKWKFHYLKNTKQHVLVKELETYSLTKGRHNVKVEMPDLDRPDNKGVIEFWKD